MRLKWLVADSKWPWYCPVHEDYTLEVPHNINGGRKFGICNLCVKGLMNRLRGEGLHESKQIKKQRRDRLRERD